MRSGAGTPSAARGLLLAVAVAGCLPPLTGCTGRDGAPPPPPTPEPAASVDDAWGQLAGRAAAAEDRRFTALYTLSAPQRPDRTVVVTAATDGSWRVDIPAGALGGTADVAVARTADGLFQCGLPSEQRPQPATCVRVGDPDGRLPAGADPKVHHPFTDWVKVLTDRQAPLSVSASEALPGVPGSCFAVESISASLAPPLDAGIYCYAEDGVLTGARLTFGTLALLGDPGAAPPAVALPGPVVDGEPLGMASPPPPPSPSVLPDVSASAG